MVSFGTEEETESEPDTEDRRRIPQNAGVKGGNVPLLRDRFQ